MDFAKEKGKSATVGRPILLDMALGHRWSWGDRTGRFAVGQLKIPFSQENLISSSDLETINRSQLGDGLVPGRDIGGQLSLTVPNAMGERLAECAIGAFNGAGINVSDDNETKDIALRGVISPTSGLSAGLSGYLGKAGAGRLDHNRVGAEAAWSRGRVWVKSEYVQGRGNGKDDERERWGWYVLTGVNLKTSWQALARYDTFDSDRDAERDRSTVVTLGANWRISPWSRLQINYDVKDEQGTEVDNNTLLAQYQVSF